jgi:hypothetical protein
MVFKNRVLRRTFGPRRDEVTGGVRKLQMVKLRNLYSSPSIIRMVKLRSVRWAWHVTRLEAKSNACRLLVGKPDGKRPLGRPRGRWVDTAIYLIILYDGLRLWSSGQFLATDTEVRVRFPALPDVLISSESGTGSTRPREYN